MWINKRFSRRNLLRGLGAGAITAPFVPILPSQAGEGGAPKRMLVFFTSNGPCPQAWDPTPDFTMSPMLSPLEPHKDQLLLLGGLTLQAGFESESGGHAAGMNGCLTGQPGVLPPNPLAPDASLASGISIDQFIAGELAADTRFPSLQSGVISHSPNKGDSGAAICYGGPLMPIVAENDPAAVWDRLFSDFTPPGSEPDPAVEQLEADRLRIVELVKSDLAALEGQLGTDDRIKMQSHLGAIETIENSLTAEDGNALDACEQPQGPGGLDHLDHGNFDVLAQTQIDLLVMALACDLTRVASLQLGPGGSGLRIPGVAGPHHGYAHDNDTDNLVIINQNFAGKFAYLLDKLGAIDEGDGTMLDNTLVVWVNELADGSNHSLVDYRFVMSGAGYFTPGRLVEYDGGQYDYNNMLVSWAHAMGLEHVTTFGDERFCNGPLAGLV